MVIRDKQSLRRCVKQAVRRAMVVETMLRFDPAIGPLGADAAMAAMAPHAGQGAPFSPDAAAVYAALDALDLPVYDLTRAQEETEGYEREAYLREVLDAMRARRVLVRVPQDRAGEAAFADERLCPLLTVNGESAFVPGRFGIPYEQAARAAADAARVCGAQDVLAENVSFEALRYALLPLCEDEGLRLHVGLHGAGEVQAFAQLMEQFPRVRALVWADEGGELPLIGAAAKCPRILVRLCDVANLGAALAQLGSRFVAFAACAAQPELALGRWLCFRERLHPLLTEAYLPLARSGYELKSEQVEADVRSLLGECLG